MLVPSSNYRTIRTMMTDPFDVFDNMAPRQSMPALMKTDVVETQKGFELTIDLPGIKKEDVTIELSEGYLEISASTSSDKSEKSEDGKVLRQERFSGHCSRKFYVGEEINEDKITAKFENGVLNITLPKNEAQPEIEEKRTIMIEG